MQLTVVNYLGKKVRSLYSLSGESARTLTSARFTKTHVPQGQQINGNLCPSKILPGQGRDANAESVF